MFKKVSLKLLLMVGICAGIVRADDSGAFSFRAGLGYDFISQEYFLIDTLDNPDPDAELNATLLTRDYLDDKKGLLYVKYKPDSIGKIELEAGWEQTPDLYRAVGRGRFRFAGKATRFNLNLDFDAKRNIDGTPDEGEEMVVLKGDTKFRYNLSDLTETSLRLYAENIDFDSVGSVTYDYSRIGFESGLNILTRDFNSLYVTGAVEKRLVPDSSQLNYFLIRGILGYFGTISGAQINGEFSAESKDYNWSDGRDDYILLTFTGDFRLPVGHDNFIKFPLSFEHFDFSADDYISDDYLLLRSGILWERDFNRLSLSLGPRLEVASIAADFENDDDYLESYLFSGVDYFGSPNLFLMFENQVGYRDYPNNPPYRSSFKFERLTLIGSGKIYRGLGLDLLFSAEWEWHENSEDDARIYLLSTSLTYSF